MNTIPFEKNLPIFSPQQQREGTIVQTKEAVFDDLKNYTDEYQHMKYYIDAVNSVNDADLGTGINYLSITLNSMNQGFQKFLERFNIDLKEIIDPLKDFYDFHKKRRITMDEVNQKVLPELKKIPDFASQIHIPGT